MRLMVIFKLVWADWFHLRQRGRRDFQPKVCWCWVVRMRPQAARSRLHGVDGRLSPRNTRIGRGSAVGHPRMQASGSRLARSSLGGRLPSRPPISRSRSSSGSSCRRSSCGCPASASISRARSSSGSRPCRDLPAARFRIVHTFLVPLYGTRHVVAVSTLLLLIPLRRLVLRGSGPDDALLGAGGACLAGRARRRQLLVVHAVDEPVLPQAPARNGARDPGRRRQFRGEHRPVRHALDHRLCARRARCSVRRELHQQRRRSAPIWLQNATAIYVPFILVFGIARLGHAEKRPGARQFPRAARHLQGEARVLHDLPLHRDLRHVLGTGSDLPASHQADLRAASGRARPTHLRLSRAADRIGCAYARGTACRTGLAARASHIGRVSACSFALSR